MELSYFLSLVLFTGDSKYLTLSYLPSFLTDAMGWG
jgi:hypothetical protein